LFSLLKISVHQNRLGQLKRSGARWTCYNTFSSRYALAAAPANKSAFSLADALAEIRLNAFQQTW
jgi:hypothetical protein